VKELAKQALPPNAPWEVGELDEYRLLCRARLKHLVPVREPLVLVSQIQRSGGTLMTQLFDGHPECHVHPEELKIGYPRKHNWPPLDLDRAESWFPVLYEPATISLERGYARRSRSELDHDRFPFLFPLGLQRRIFDEVVAGTVIERERDVLDCYLTSYFNAWLDNHNLYTGPKKIVMGFTPRLAMKLDNVERFFAAYPDGTLIFLVREPRAWFASAREHKERYADVEKALRLWRESAEGAIAAQVRFGDRVLLLTYERLVLEPEPVMVAVANRIGITMLPSLVEPTFNGRPIRAQSSYPVEEHGILTDRLGIYRERLDARTIARVEQLAGDTYERAAALATP
jgi:hypothetical protein